MSIPLTPALESAAHAERAVDAVDAVPSAAAILADPSASRWLVNALSGALMRDPVDALNDALVLAAVLESQLRENFGLPPER